MFSLRFSKVSRNCFWKHKHSRYLTKYSWKTWPNWFD